MPTRSRRGTLLAEALTALLLVATGLGAGCTFRPKVPSGTVSCEQHSDCPRGFSCLPAPAGGQGKLCCAGESCAGVSNPTDARRADAVGGPDAGSGTSPDTRADDAAMGDAGPSDGGDAGGDGDGSSAVTSLVACTPAVMPPPAGPLNDLGQQTSCTIALQDAAVVLTIDSFQADDPASIRTQATCQGALRLADETTDPTTMARRPLPPAAMQTLIALIEHYKGLCGPYQARIVGPVAGRWARELPEQASFATELASQTGLMLEVPTPAEEQQQVYLGVTRNRRRRIVLDPRTASAEVTFWSRTAAAPIRRVVPISFAAAANEYFSHPAYTDFEGARRNLRGRLRVDMSSAISELGSLVRSGAAEPFLLVGPADALVPLALDGRLRTAGVGWDEVDVVGKKLADAAAVVVTGHGHVYGSVTASRLGAFFTSIDVTQFAQLREQPRRSAYGEQLMVLTTVLELLASELRLQEVAFVQSSASFGYTLGKLFPTP